MDGVKRHLSDSLQNRLSFWISIAILGVAVLAGMYSFLTAFEEAHELQDDILRQVAALYDGHNLPPKHASIKSLPGDTEAKESQVIVEYLDTGTPQHADTTSPSVLPLSATLADGLHTIDDAHIAYRILVKTLKSGIRFAVAQETAVRDEIARDSALRALMPFFLLVPILLLLVASIVRKMFRPLAVISTEINQRSEQDLHPLPLERLPIEVRPFGAAINHLLTRIDRSMTAQRRFVADAAHELRSPLTAISLQAEHLAGVELSEQARERLGSLTEGIERSRNQLEQLLAHARAQSLTQGAEELISVQQVYRRVLEDMLPIAAQKNIDLGMTGENDAQVKLREIDLFSVVRNLVDNAIRYTTAGGRVDLSIDISPAWVTLVIMDNGPGIPEEYRERVLDPFYRVLGNQSSGSGLGLSIVQTIISRSGGRLILSDASATAGGLKVSIQLPKIAM